MVWDSSKRREQLPSNWPNLRRQTLARDSSRCRWQYPNGGRCPEEATDVDHIARGNDHSLSNLQSLCRRHHNLKTGREASEQRVQNFNVNNAKFRRVERHPGLL
jgi:5-methylcytosine-specific restriction protein A